MKIGEAAMRIDGRLAAMREAAKNVRDPSTEDETLRLLLGLARAKSPERILEIGTAEGLTSAALLLECAGARVTTVELDEERHRRAKEIFAFFGVSDRVNAILGDAADVLAKLDGPFQLIFLDGPKAQYVRYLPDLKRLLPSGGVLVADDVLLNGWVDGKVPVPNKRRSIVQKIREYLIAAEADPDFITSILDVGEGVALSVKR